MSWRTKPFLVLLLTLIGHSLPARAGTADPLLASIRKAGQAKVALGSAPPYIAVSPDGKATGYVIEVIDLALKGMGLPALAPVLTAWDAQIPGLQAHQFDFSGANVITEARCKAVLFTAPFYAMRDALYVLPGNPKHLTGFSELARSPEIKLAVVRGSSQEAYALKKGLTPERLVLVTDIQAGAATVIGHRADAFAVGQFTIVAPEQKGLEVVVDEQAPPAWVGCGIS
ncbi:transporter substrate-binding domain-containing protein [Bradyrhizobium sp. DASA03076]|uniref:transporter substrate-binding domain-containing protein n=1 Tax=Bradyrhizobium sp. BLXBL-03 TaxID=3395916 RepID=UPI003F71530A